MRASRIFFGGSTNRSADIIKTAATITLLLSVAVTMPRAGQVRQRLESAHQRVSRYAQLLETARNELQALQQEATRQSRQHHVPAPPAPAPAPAAPAVAATGCVECGKFYRELRRPQREWYQCWRCTAHRCDKCAHLVCGCLQDMDSPASP